MPRVLVLSLLVLAAAGGVAASASGSGTPAVFTGPTTMPGSSGGNEPSVAVSTGGTRYVTWQAPGTFASSPDGVGFTNVGSPDANALGDTADVVDAAGALYDSQICGPPTALHTCVYRSLDGGRTWPQTTYAADMHPGASDRPWLDVYPRHASGWSADRTTVYLEYHTFSPDDLVYVTVSHDGGKTFSPPNLVTTDTNALSGSGCNTIPSGIAVDQRTGAVYALWLSGNDVAKNLTTGCNYSQLGPFDKAWVSVSTDGGATWTSHLAWQGAYDPSTGIGDNADKIFGTIAVDGAGQVHVLLPVRHSDDPVGFVAGCETSGSGTGTAPPVSPVPPPPSPVPPAPLPSPLPSLPPVPPLPGGLRVTSASSASGCSETPQRTDLVLVSSPDAGAHWTSPLDVNQFAGSYFFPWAAAGASGNVDVVYYRSDTLRPNDPASRWGIGFSQITGATATVSGSTASYVSPPQVSELLLDPNPVHVGGICTFGIFCSAVPQANRHLADSIGLALDANGGANAAWTNDASQRDASGNPLDLVEFACQSGGVSATGVVLDGCNGTAPATAPAPAAAAPAPAAAPHPRAAKAPRKSAHRTVRGRGVVRGAGGGAGATFAVDLASGRLVYVDRAHGVRFRATRILRVRFAGRAATISGVGRLDGRRVRFVVRLVDRGGRGDSFRLVLGHGRTLGGRLRSGRIVVGNRT